LAQFWRAFGISGEGEFEHPNPPPRYATVIQHLVSSHL